MENKKIVEALPPIPDKRYFTIGEVGELCGVKPHVLRYWEQEFSQLKPVKRRGNRRYYRQQEVLLVRKIRELLYERGFTINGARNHMALEQNKLTPKDEAMNAQAISFLDFCHIRSELKSIVSHLRA